MITRVLLAPSINHTGTLIVTHGPSPTPAHAVRPLLISGVICTRLPRSDIVHELPWRSDFRFATPELNRAERGAHAKSARPYSVRSSWSWRLAWRWWCVQQPAGPSWRAHASSAGRVALAGHPGARVLGLCSVFCQTAGPEPPAVLLRLDYRPPAHRGLVRQQIRRGRCRC